MSTIERKREHVAILCLGSNVCDRNARLESAIETLRTFSELIFVDKPVMSEDVTRRGEYYLNISVECRTELDSKDFANRLRELEAKMGRNADSKISGIMPLDADLVIWDDTIISPNDYNAAYFTLRDKELES